MNRAAPSLLLFTCAGISFSARTAGATEPDGAPITFGARPVLAHEVRACSLQLPICVHASSRTAPTHVLAVVASAERAWQAATWGLDLPPPDIDLSTGSFDVYLSESRSESRSELGERDPVASFDRASAFVRLDPDLEGCALDVTLARETLRSIAWRTAPATDAGTARAEAAYLARLIVPCALEAPGSIDAYQAHPETSITGIIRGSRPDELPEPSTTYADGASLFYWWLDYSFGNSPGSVVRALWALAPTETPLGSSLWASHPVGLDVLRASFKDALTSGSTIDDLFLDFAVARAFVGSTSDDETMPETRGLGAAGQLHLTWSVDWPKSPRTLASARGIEPTGATYIAVDCGANRPPGARLRFEAEWEEHAKMRWAALKLDDAGQNLGEVTLPGPDRGVGAQGTVAELEHVARVLLVGTNTGDPFRAFDPSDETPEPHGWQVSVASEIP